MKFISQTVCTFGAHIATKKPPIHHHQTLHLGSTTFLYFVFAIISKYSLPCSETAQGTTKPRQRRLGTVKKCDIDKSEHHRDAICQAANSWFIMLDFAGITPSAILVKKWRGKPLFMALRRDLPGNPLSAQIYLEIE